VNVGAAPALSDSVPLLPMFWPGRMQGRTWVIYLAAMMAIAGIGTATLLAPTSARAAAPGQRVTIAVVGDSIVESFLPSGRIRRGLNEQLQSALAARGFRSGGEGFQAASPFRWNFDDWATELEGPPSPSRWLIAGSGGLPAPDGPSGYSAIASSPRRIARLDVRDPLVAILYTTTSKTTPFTVRAGAREWTIDAFAAGPPRPAQAWLALPPGPRLLTVIGPAQGALILSGAVGRVPLPASGTQVEVSNLGHAGRPPFPPIGARALQSFNQQRYDVVVFVWSFVAEAIAQSYPSPSAVTKAYEHALLARARAARAAGSICAIADSAPTFVRPAVQAKFQQIHRRVARAAGCRWITALRGVWKSSDAARRAGLLTADGAHPTVAGYRRYAQVLAPVLGPLIAARARHPRPQVVEQPLPPVRG
jgi:lysophospholipase L1-like esterase